MRTNVKNDDPRYPIMQICTNKKNKLLKKSRYGAIDGFVVFTGFPDASTVFPDASTVFPDASVGEENSENVFPNIPLFPEGSVVFPEGSVELPEGSVELPEGSEENNENGSLNVG